MEEFAKNKYVRRAKISEYKFRKMVKYFAEDLSATQISLLTSINRNTVNRYLNEIRGRIVEFCEQHAPFVEEQTAVEPLEVASPDMETSGSTFSTKISTNLGLLKRRGKVYAEMLANCTSTRLGNLMHARAVAKEVTVHAVEVKEDSGIIAVGYDNNQAFADKPSYVDNLDKFWQFVKERTAKFQGVAKHKYYLHLKESEFRFNFRNDNLYRVMLQLISAKPLT